MSETWYMALYLSSCCLSLLLQLSVMFLSDVSVEQSVTVRAGLGNNC